MTTLLERNKKNLDQLLKKQSINELEDIPIKTHEYKPDSSKERIEPRTQEVDRTPRRFNLNDYKLKAGKIYGSSEDDVDTKLEAWITKMQAHLAESYAYGNDEKGYYAKIVYYINDVSKLDQKYKNALQTKISDFAKKYSKEDAQPKTQTSQPQNKTRSDRTEPNVTNIQKAIANLSKESLKDLDKYVRALQNYEKTK